VSEGAVASASVREALESATDALAAAGVDDAGREAELLLAEACACGRAALLADPSAGVDPVAARRFGGMVRRRLRREPVAYILGFRGFRRIELSVDPRVLIPRPETELLVEVALELQPATALDVGTGSGAVALAIADELADATVVGADTSPAALEVALGNAERLGLGRRVSFVGGSVPAGGVGFDLLVANLPYVSEGEWEGLQPEIVRFEPREALVAGPTGLEAIERLLGAIAVGDVRAGAVALEVGEGQAGTVSELVRRAGYEDVEVRKDLAGIERVVVGR
jgi:release factor glutamine methyltransferase